MGSYITGLLKGHLISKVLHIRKTFLTLCAVYSSLPSFHPITDASMLLSHAYVAAVKLMLADLEKFDRK